MYLLSVRGVLQECWIRSRSYWEIHKRKIKNYEQIVNDINQLESVMETLSDDELHKNYCFSKHVTKWKNS